MTFSNTISQFSACRIKRNLLQMHLAKMSFQIRDVYNFPDKQDDGDTVVDTVGAGDIDVHDNQKANNENKLENFKKQFTENCLTSIDWKSMQQGEEHRYDSSFDHTTSAINRNLSCNNSQHILIENTKSLHDLAIELKKQHLLRSHVSSLSPAESEKNGNGFFSGEVWIRRAHENKMSEMHGDNNIFSRVKNNTGSTATLKEKNCHNNDSSYTDVINLTCDNRFDQSVEKDFNMCKLQKHHSVKISEKWKVQPVQSNDDNSPKEDPFFTNFTGILFNIQDTRVKCMEDWRDAVLHNYSVSQQERNSVLTIHTFKFLLSRLVDNRLMYTTEDGYRVIGSRRRKPRKNKYLCFGYQQLDFEQDEKNLSEVKENDKCYQRKTRTAKLQKNGRNSIDVKETQEGKKRKSRNMLTGYFCMKVVVKLSKTFALL